MWPGDHGPARYGARPACTGSAGRATCALAVRWRSYQRDISSIATHAAEHPTKRDTRPAPQPHRSTIQANTVGDAAFWSGIRDYYARHRNQNASTDEFRACMEDAAGLDLKWFFDQWLTRSGVPRLEGEWRYDAQEKLIEVTVRQTQTTNAFRLSLEIGVIDGDGRLRTQEVVTDRKLERYAIHSEAAPARVVFDPAVWLLYDAGPLSQAR